MARVSVAVGSGKGGVGKSTITLNLALVLAAKGMRVGVLDADVYGPNIPRMLNLKRTTPASGWMLARNPELGQRSIEPIDAFGVKVMSMALAVSEDQALAWDGGLVRVLTNQLLCEVDWGPLDLLLIDMPPGTGNIHHAICEVAKLDGVVLVVTPQDVAHLDARRAVSMYRQRGVRILGGVENMSGLACPHCQEHVQVFHPVSDDRSLWATGVDPLGAVPLDPHLSEMQDGGRPAVLDGSNSAAVEALRAVASRLESLIT
jgi:ATP-binding protein involved in chromosome partitioning